MAIVHICGAPGSGKTTLANRLRKYYRTRVVVQELDELESQFVAKCSEDAISPTVFERTYQALYQLYIAEFIKRMSPKPIVFVGTNFHPVAADIPFRSGRITRPAMHYEVCSSHFFYISLPVSTIAAWRHAKTYEQNIDRYKTYLQSKKTDIIRDMLVSEADTTHKLAAYLSSKIFKVAEVRRETADFHNFFKFRGYTMLSPDEIYAALRKILT